MRFVHISQDIVWPPVPLPICDIPPRWPQEEIMNAVGIDVSKGKSMMAALRPMGEIALRPKEYPHTEVGLE